MTPKTRRSLFLIISLALVAAGVVMLLNVFSQNLVFFYSPSDLASGHAPQGRMIRIGGLVEEGSITRDGEALRFSVTDNERAAAVRFNGLPPALFREGQGVVVEGAWDGASFTATRILTKHDENYMPPEVAQALKEKGLWKAEAGTQVTPGMLRLPEKLP